MWFFKNDGQIKIHNHCKLHPDKFRNKILKALNKVERVAHGICLCLNEPETDGEFVIEVELCTEGDLAQATVWAAEKLIRFM